MSRHGRKYKFPTFIFTNRWDENYCLYPVPIPQSDAGLMAYHAQKINSPEHGVITIPDNLLHSDNVNQEHPAPESVIASPTVNPTSK